MPALKRHPLVWVLPTHAVKACSSTLHGEPIENARLRFWERSFEAFFFRISHFVIVLSFNSRLFSKFEVKSTMRVSNEMVQVLEDPDPADPGGSRPGLYHRERR